MWVMLLCNFPKKKSKVRKKYIIFEFIFQFLLFQVFERDGQDYFVDMMPALHNYVTIDTGAFLTGGGTTREYPTMVFNMCKKMLLESDPGNLKKILK